MYCPICNSSFDGPEDGGNCPNCGARYDYTGSWAKGVMIDDDGYHETGSDAGEGDILLDEMADGEKFDW